MRDRRRLPLLRCMRPARDGRNAQTRAQAANIGEVPSGPGGARVWHTRDVQRLCALFLLTLSAWLLVAPLATAPREESLLPACCRRAGAHHCMQGLAAAHASDRRQASFRAAGCLLMPHASPAWLQSFAATAGFAGIVYLAARACFYAKSASEGYACALALKSPRGPPWLSLA